MRFDARFPWGRTRGSPMRSSQKIALTLLIAFVLTLVFAALAYTGLFRVLETDFFSQGVKADQGLRLERIAGGVAGWKDDNLSRFDVMVRDRNFQAVYSVNQREEEIQFRARTMDALSDRLMGFSGLRVVDVDGRIPILLLCRRHRRRADWGPPPLSQLESNRRFFPPSGF